MSGQDARIIFFGDQTVDTLQNIKVLANQARTSPIIARFLRECADVVQVNLSELDTKEKQPYLRFESILELAEIFAEQNTPFEAVSTVLFFIAQFGDLLFRAENDPSFFKASRNSPSYSIGLCTGLLPAAAAATARDVGELLTIGRVLIPVAYRLGVQQWRSAHEIEGAPGSWAVAIVSVDPQEIENIINAFNDDMAIPQHRHIYISTLAHRWAVISGPPSLFPELWSYSKTLASASKMSVPIGTPAHAPHIQPIDISKVLGQSPVYELPIRDNVHVISTSTCQPFEGLTLGDVLTEALGDITCRMLNLAGVIDYIISELHDTEMVNLDPLGPKSQIDSFKKALENGGINFTTQSVQSDVRSGLRDGSDLVAVVGMSARLPGSEDIDSFWEILQAGQKIESEVPASRFDLETHYDPTGVKKNTITTPYGSFLDNPELFDNRLFNVSPREAKQMDPIQRILLMCSYEALQMAGYTAEAATLSTNRGRIATYFGQSADDWREANNSQDVDIFFIQGGVRPFSTGRLNYHYKWAGGNYSVDSACAGSSTSVILAVNALLSRECDTALAGGGSIYTATTQYAGLSRAGFLSKTLGGCKTFREDADGYLRGEGVGLVVLKRLEDAIADNDNVLAVLRRGARNYSWNSSSITHPSADAQVNLIRQVLRNADIDPKDVNFVEAHGTGTQAGDAMEMEAMTRVFGSDRAEDNPLYIGAVKASVGHGEAASGITSLIKAIEMIRRKTIPKQPGFPGPLNPKFPPLGNMNIHIPDQTFPFNSSSSSKDGKRRILINNFDASGGNNSMLLEDAPERQHKSDDDPRKFYTVAVSARTTYSLQNNARRLLEYLESHQDVQLSDLAYTTTARRIHEDLRKAYTVQSVSELQQLLATDLKKDFGSISPSNPPSSVVFTFTGQGSQYAGMGKQLFATSPRFRKTVESLQDVCTWHGFPSFIDLIASGDVEIGAYSAVQVQLAIAVIELALADLWKSWGIEPDVVIGYSLGEYAALHVAGVLSVHDVLYIVGKRATLIQEKCTPGTHAMLAVQASESDIKDKLLAYPSCEVSCKGAPNSNVVSGPADDIVNLQSQMKKEGYSSTLLEIPYGFHSSQVDPILEEFGELLDGINFAKPRIPVASTLKGAIVTEEGVFSPSYLEDQARQPVDFVGALKACQAANLIDDKTVWIEIGPKPVLSALTAASLGISRDKLLYTISNKDDNWKTISASTTSAYLCALPLSWTKFHKDYTEFLTLLQLPTYAFDLKKYWVTTKSATPPVEPAPVPEKITTPLVPGFPNASLQRVKEESIEASKATVTFESMTCEPTLLPIIQGHLINGVPLCPASAFMDMAFSAAKYLYLRINPGSSVPAMSLTGLNIIHPLIPDPRKKPDQTVIIKAEKVANSQTVNINFKSRCGKFSDDHGSCQVHFSDEKQWKAEWSNNAYFIDSAKSSLVQRAMAGTGHRLHKKVVYKLFANLVRYDEPFQAMQEVFVEEDFSSDAVAIVKLSPANQSRFTFSPYWSDSLIHVAGFVLNGKPNVDDDNHWIASGFGSFRALQSVQPGVTYESYVHIRPGAGQNTAHCDVYIFEGNEIVGSSTGIIFTRMSRRVLEAVIGKGDTYNSSAPTPAKPSAVPTKALPQSKVEVFQSGRTSPSLSDTESGETPGTSVDGDDADEVISIILAKTGFDAADAEPFTKITDMGLDSLLTIEVISELKNSLGLELPASFFNHNPTIADVRRALGNDDKPAPKPKKKKASVVAPVVTPVAASTYAPTPSSSESDAEMAISTILAKTGFDPADVEPFTRITDMGLDSILTIEVISELKSTIGLELPASFFNHNPTVADVRKALSDEDEPKAETPVVSSHSNQSAAEEPAAKNTRPISSYHSNVVLVQGRSKSKKTPLFLVTDGAGSSMSYMHLPPLFSGDNPVYACESPFLDKPEDFTYTIEEVSDLYAEAIRKIQPHGPYLLGGWSLGGLYAFEVSKRFINAGEVVKGLFVLDFKFPVSSKAKNQIVPSMEMVEMIGVANGVNIPGKGFIIAPSSPKTKLHSLQSVRAAVKYVLDPMKPGRAPLNTYVIWAGQGLETLLGGIPAGIEEILKQEKLHSDPDTDTQAYTMLLWFFGKRKEQEGPDGWDVATQSEVHCSSLPCDHFSMVNKSFANI
ncbi:Type I Iterative PKS [Trichoderma atroviride]|uniref:Type I Iterative PKS n=1 Tax=Hypocrea atroviridis TaxID=63577 RepID=UPI003322752D|nr:Type I Iterative PKS [Trichoderma atroviride]